MDELSQEDRDFLDALAGRKPGTAGQQALRAELLAAAQAMQEALEAVGSTLTGDELIQREALRAQLIQAGALPGRDAEPAVAVSALDVPATVSPAKRPEASNDARYPLSRLAASDGDDGRNPVSYQSRGFVAGDFKIHRSYSKARDVVLLRFEASSAAAPACVGRRVLIEVPGREPIDLGVVDERGETSCAVPAPVVLADAMVNIGS